MARTADKGHMGPRPSASLQAARSIWDVRSGKCSHMLSTSCGNTYLAWSPDGNSFATKNENDVLTLYDFRKMRAAKHPYKFAACSCRQLIQAMELPLPWLCSDDTFADTVLQLCPGAVLAVHRSELSSHSQRLMAGPLRREGSGSQGAADFLPSTAVAHFAKDGSLPEGLTVSQLAQVCKEARAQGDMECAEACSQAIVNLALEEAPSPQPLTPHLFEIMENQPECHATLMVMRYMYEGGLPEEVKEPLTLARVCLEAERLAVPSLKSSCLRASCLQTLADLPPSQLSAEQLVLVLQTLPDSCALLPEHKKWQQHVNSLILSQYGDVHAVITDAQLRGYFQQLPFAAVLQWAGSDALTVDSENSVVELISLWMAGPTGKGCSWVQKEQLSCLVRVQHLSPAYAQVRLHSLEWFDIPGAPMNIVVLAASCRYGMTGVFAVPGKAPPAWSAAPRKPLDPDELLRRSTIRWDVPRQQLLDLLASKATTAKIYSEPVYLAGTGCRLHIKFSKKESQDAAAGFTLGVFSEPVSYAQCGYHTIDSVLQLCSGDKSPDAGGTALPVHRAVLSSHSGYFRARLLRWEGSGSQGAADFLPSTAVAHFAKDGSVPEGLTVSQLAQVCKEAKAQGDKRCAEACSQAIVNRALEEAGSPQPPTPRLEETFDSQDECDAARLVVRCMYEGKLPEEVKDPLTLARVCRVAERWAFSSLSSSCLKQLADLPPSQLAAEQLVLVLQTLPDSCALLPEHQQWQDRVHSLAGKLNALPLLLHLYGDVHAVITSAQLRTTFQQLPFAAVQQWAGSDALTVDSENSVVELISLWMAGPTGKGCSWVQKEQLSCLVRVQHLSPAEQSVHVADSRCLLCASTAYAQVRLPSLKWFHILGAQNDIVVLAASCRYGMAGVFAVPGDAPPAWSAAPRKPLDSAELRRRSTIRWDVPRQQLLDLLASKDLTAKVYSEPVYMAGTGWRISMKLSKKNSQDMAAGFTLGVFSELVSYAQCEHHYIGEKMKAAPLEFALHRPASIPAGIAWTSCTMVTDWGWADWLQTALVSPEELEPFLEGGCLQVTACFRVPEAGKAAVT
ncbi:hypothetical protein QJQ45_028686 [Haematococcus lacustris]|nr:hypothetical protein QJQ45_028686 [Haematococcus lacustris]